MQKTVWTGFEQAISLAHVRCTNHYANSPIRVFFELFPLLLFHLTFLFFLFFLKTVFFLFVFLSSCLLSAWTFFFNFVSLFSKLWTFYQIDDFFFKNDDFLIQLTFFKSDLLFLKFVNFFQIWLTYFQILWTFSNFTEFNESSSKNEKKSISLIRVHVFEKNSSYKEEKNEKGKKGEGKGKQEKW